MATHIKELLNKFLQEKRSECKETERLQRVIDENLDARLAKHVTLKKVYKNKLIFCTDTSNFVYEFNLKKSALLKAVQKEFPHIEDAKITIG
ncbi:MAG: DciA family protein [Candidatus Omnitrophica bacterium]|nr:DciA family protein [Candidatus Omnitrophota bacterium]